MIISVLSFFCLTGGTVLALFLASPIVIFLSFSVIRSPDFSDVFLFTLSLKCETPNFNAFLPDCLANFFYNRWRNSFHRSKNIINDNPRPNVSIYKYTKLWMINSRKFKWFHYINVLYYSTLFRINEKDVSTPFRSTNLLFPSVMCILTLLIIFLLVGLYVTLCGSMVNE